MTTTTFPLPNIDTDLSGRVALVTGAAGALGRRFAQLLASCGASVALADVRMDELRSVEAALKESGYNCIPTYLDLTDVGRIAETVAGIERELGVVDILINNAGINDANRPHRLSHDVISKVISTNLEGPFVLSCEVAKTLIAKGMPGRIVNVSSTAAYCYTQTTASPVYSITKAAVSRMTEVLAVEWARHRINVTAVAPGLFWSEMTEGMISRVGDPSATYPRQRIGYPAQLDSTILYLVGPSSECVTGTVIKVDDGQKPR